MNKDLVYPKDATAGTICDVKINIATNDPEKYINFYFFEHNPNHLKVPNHSKVWNVAGSISLAGYQVKDLINKLANICGSSFPVNEPKVSYKIVQVSGGYTVLEIKKIGEYKSSTIATFCNEKDAQEFINLKNTVLSS